MTDGSIRRSLRARKPPKGLSDIYATPDVDVDAVVSQPAVSKKCPERSVDEQKGNSLPSRNKKKGIDSKKQLLSRKAAATASPTQHHGSALADAERMQAVLSAQAPGSQLRVNLASDSQIQTRKSEASSGRPQKTLAKRRKSKYDPEPMKIVALQAQDILEPVSEIDVPAAGDPCAALNCRPSAPVSQEAFREQARTVLVELQQRLNMDEDDGADIDTSAMLLPEPGVADDAEASAAAGADDPDEAFADQLAEAGKVLQSLESRLKGRRTTKRLYFRAPAAEKAEAGAIIVPGQDWLSSEEVVITMGILRFAQLTCLQEFNVLPRQPLTVLRDKLSCPADSHLGTLGMSVPGAYFYIEGAFYNDTRQPGAVDYSEPVLKFCVESNLMPPRLPRKPSCEACWDPAGLVQPGEYSEQPSGTYKTASMHETRFSDLEHLRIGGTGYIYCHQGCCEHALYIKDIRRIHPDDPQQASAYPVQTFQASYRRQKCSICVARYATKITYEDKYAPATPGFWCTECYEAMHYHAEGKLKVNHKVFALPVVV